MVEEKLLQFIDGRADEMIQFTKELMVLPSSIVTRLPDAFAEQPR